MVDTKEISNAILDAIFHAIDETSEELPPDKQLVKDVDTVLFGKGGVLDSLGLVSLIVATEQRIEEQFDTSITIANEKAISMKKSPFRTVQSLADYIATLLAETDVD